jgi:ankyrin repeat protein
MLDVVRCLISELGAEVHDLDNGCPPLYIAAQKGHTDVVRCLVKEFGADMYQANQGVHLSFSIAAQNGHTAILRCMVIELAYDVNTASHTGATPCFMAAKDGNLALLRCLVRECGADINQATHKCMTPLMAASFNKHADTVRWMVKEGADPTASKLSRSGHAFTATNISRQEGASAEQTVYLEAKTHCSNPSCSGAGIKRCPACKQARYCGEPCQYAHWKAHTGDCKRWSADLKAGMGARGK